MKLKHWMLCGLLLSITHAAVAESLRVDAMSLVPDARWRRGDPTREKEDAAYLLEWPVAEGARGVALQVAIPLRATPLMTGAEDFYANLYKKWTQQYGKRAEIGQIEIAGVRWLACRRPANSGDASVFHLVTAHAGRAYSVLAFAGAEVKGLPKPAYDLLAAADFGVAARPWVFHRVVAAQPAQAALETLVAADAERLGHDGMLTGYGIQYVALPELAGAGQGLRLNWFLEGFRWRNRGGRDERLPLDRRGYLDAWVAANAAAPTLTVRFAGAANTAVEAEVGLLDLCAPAADVDAALARLAAGVDAPLEALVRARPQACPPAPAGIPPRFPRARPGQSVVETLEFPVAPTPAAAAGLSQLRVLYARPRLAGSEAEAGQRLLRGTGLYFVFTRE